MIKLITFKTSSSSPDSVHNDGERHIPYITIFPDSELNKIIAWAKYQVQPNLTNAGMIYEELRQGYLDLPYPPRVSGLSLGSFLCFVLTRDRCEQNYFVDTQLVRKIQTHIYLYSTLP